MPTREMFGQLGTPEFDVARPVLRPTIVGRDLPHHPAILA
jgi:hypothetical protein